jgi:hypothetical protein
MIILTWGDRLLLLPMHFLFSPASVRAIKLPSGWFEHRGEKVKVQKICSTSSQEETTWHGRILFKSILKPQIMKIMRGRCCEFYKFSGPIRYVTISSGFSLL